MKKANVIILAGQSNAVGVGHIKYLSKHFDSDTVSAILKGYGNALINYMSHDIASGGFVKTTVNCTERSKDTLGPEIGIAKKLAEKYPNEQFFIIKCAYGGTNMVNDWRSPSSGVPYREELTAEPANAIASPAFRFPGWCYNTFIKLMKDSIDTLKKEGYDPSVIAFCWMQGESDAENYDATEAYISRYDALLNDIRSTFAPYFDHCAFIDAAVSGRWQHYAKINEYKKTYAAKQGHHYLDTLGAGLTTLHEPEEDPDTAHYDCGSTVKLGEMFAEKITL